MELKGKLKTLTQKKASVKSLLFYFVTIIFLVWPGGAYSIGTTGVLSGKVIDKETDKPIENAFITAKNPSDTLTTITNSNGFFSIAGAPVGAYELTVERVGYQSTAYQGISVTGDATTNMQLALSSQAVAVSGVTVTASRPLIVNPRLTMTNYGYTDEELRQVLPGPARLGITALGSTFGIPAIYETLPGVQIGFDAYYGSGSPHIRGGTGSDIGYAFDGVPTYETITNTFGTALANIGTGRTDFYVGGYPAQYGNFPSGFINQIVPRGSGQIHGNIEYQSGFWADVGTKLPTYESPSGTKPAYTGIAAYAPTNIRIQLQGKDRRFSYYFDHLIQDSGNVFYPKGVDLKPIISINGGIQNGFQERDTVLNLNYDFNNYNTVQLLFYTGIQKANFAGFQEIPCAGGGNCSGGSSGTGFGETYNANVIAPLPDMHNIASYDLQKLEWTHRFHSPGKVMNLRLWHYSPSVYFDNFAAPVTFWQFRRAVSNGALLEYQNQLNSQHLLDAGASYNYSNNYLLSDVNNILGFSGGTYFASGQGLTYNTTTGLGTLHTQQVPDTLTWGAWISDEWRPTPKWDITAGLRYDRQAYFIVPGVNGNPVALSVPGYTNGVLQDPGVIKPSALSPRVGASYRLSNKLTMKASYGKFVNFAPARRIERVTGARDSAGAAYGQGISSFQAGFTPPPGTTTTPFGAICPDTAGCYRFPANMAQWLAGSKLQTAESLDVSWEYQLDDNTYVKLTPYLKHIKDPLQAVTVGGLPVFTNAGTIESKGIELYLKSRDWHGLSGWLSYTYSSTRGSQLPYQSDLIGTAPICSPASGCSATGPFSLAQAASSAGQIVPTSYDQRHILSVNLNYKIGKWDIAPSFTYGSGLPYGLGSTNLTALAALQDQGSTLYGGTRTPAQSAAAIPGFNPRNETSFNGLRQPGWWLGNLAVTYHFTDNVEATLTVLNLLNSKKVLALDNTVTGGLGYSERTHSNNPRTGPSSYTSNDQSANILPQYDPVLGQYAPVGYPNLRQFFATVRYKY